MQQTSYLTLTKGCFISRCIPNTPKVLLSCHMNTHMLQQTKSEATENCWKPEIIKAFTFSLGHGCWQQLLWIAWDPGVAVAVSPAAHCCCFWRNHLRSCCPEKAVRPKWSAPAPLPCQAKRERPGVTACDCPPLLTATAWKPEHLHLAFSSALYSECRLENWQYWGACTTHRHIWCHWWFYRGGFSPVLCVLHSHISIHNSFFFATSAVS